MLWLRHVQEAEHLGEMRNAFQILIRKHEEKSTWKEEKGKIKVRVL